MLLSCQKFIKLAAWICAAIISAAPVSQAATVNAPACISAFQNEMNNFCPIYKAFGEIADYNYCLNEGKIGILSCSNDHANVMRSFQFESPIPHNTTHLTPWNGKPEITFSLAATPQVGANQAAIYRCAHPNNGADFPSTSANCENSGFVNDGLLGYSLPAEGNLAVYRCKSGGDHFLSHQQTCEGKASEGLIAYSRPAPLEYLEPAVTEIAAYSNSLEDYEDSTFPKNGWTTFHNCAANTSWSVGRVNTSTAPAPGGEKMALRLRTTKFTAGCAWPGAYADSRKFPVVEGRTYTVNAMIRNASYQGSTQTLFYTAAGQEIYGNAIYWNSDSGVFNAETPLSIVAPAGAVTMKLRFNLSTPSATADIDLIRVTPTALPGLIYSNSFDSLIGWKIFHNCATNSSWSVTQYNTSGDAPVNGTGKMALRFHTTGFTASCINPGAYADSPLIKVVPGKTYSFSQWIRNGANLGNTQVLFYNASNQWISTSNVTTWTTGAWKYTLQTAKDAIAPVGAATMRVRYRLAIPNTYTDIDSVRVFLK